MKRNLLIILVVAALAVSFCGCSQAKSSTQGVSGNDRDTGSYTDGSADVSLDDELEAEKSANEMSYAGDNAIPATFVKKVDGDTAWFLINEDGNDLEVKVRFLGIDTPETVKENTEVQKWGPEASAYTEDALTNASEIALEFDDGSDAIDKYGRYLAWVWVDGELLNQALVENGLAKVAYLYGDYLYTDRLMDAEESAQERGVGLWE